MKSEKKIIVLFDGVCNLCNGFVNFIIKRDKQARIKFAPLQANIAKDILTERQFNHQELNSVVVLIDDKIYTKSSAALMILKELGGVWAIFYVLIYLPKFIRDFVYSLIAKNRYRIFGKKETCMIPTPEIASRFL
ncbi:MAG: thiol-disulfide oxidoreductase DCC family protein [Chitinophagaceae bacterium]|nr:thiol-disulfide oxidoreductase DCC family protein [Chitinophagaceae bacterium]